MRIGQGYDIHRLVPGRKLILGGVEIAHPTGLLGHSDADALVHAVCDALLGAAAQGDIGKHFPDNDPCWRGTCSLYFLRRIRDLLASAGWEVVNVDSTILAEKPRLAPFLLSMRENIASALQISPDQVSVKAGTNEKMDAIGREEAIACQAIALVRKRQRIEPQPL